MKTREYLEQLTDIQLRINAINRQIAECHDRALNTAAPDSGTTSNYSSGSRIERSVDKIMTLEELLDKLKKEYESFRIRVTAEIMAIPNNLYSALLYEKYINGLSWERVAEVIGTDPDYTRKVLHDRALTEFDRITPEKARKNPEKPCYYLR